MSFWTAIVIMVAVWGLVSVIRSRHNSALGYASDEDGNPVIEARDPAAERELRAEVERLRKRLEVLERIATEDRESKRLTAEIESLRSRD